MINLSIYSVKNIIITLILTVSAVHSIAQSQWTGNPNTTEGIYRNGSVGIGTTSIHSFTMLQVGNSLGLNSSSGQQEINFNAKYENAQGALYRRMTGGIS